MTHTMTPNRKALPWGTRLEHLAPEIQSSVPFDLVLAADCSDMASKAELNLTISRCFVHLEGPESLKAWRKSRSQGC